MPRDVSVTRSPHSFRLTTSNVHQMQVSGESTRVLFVRNEELQRKPTVDHILKELVVIAVVLS